MNGFQWRSRNSFDPPTKYKRFVADRDDGMCVGQNLIRWNTIVYSCWFIWTRLISMCFVPTSILLPLPDIRDDANLLHCLVNAIPCLDGPSFHGSKCLSLDALTCRPNTHRRWNFRVVSYLSNSTKKETLSGPPQLPPPPWRISERYHASNFIKHPDLLSEAVFRTLRSKYPT